MTDEASPATPPANITRANVTGKIPQAGNNQRRASAPTKPTKMTSSKKQHARRLKKLGLISDSAASRSGL